MSQSRLVGTILAGFVLLPILGAQGIVPKSQSNGVPSRLLNRLQTGVNVTRWFCYQYSPKVSHFTTYFTESDYDALKRIHASFVRLCISPEIANSPEAATPLDSAVSQLIQRGLVVLYDLHDNGQLKLDTDPAAGPKFVSYWESKAKQYRGKFEDSLVFELLNEPTFSHNSQDWYALQQQAVKAIRAIDPRRTIMVTSTSWSGIDSFAAMKPLLEKNLVYTFHCYDPFFFTHQGASWVGEKPKEFKSVPFPASKESVGAILGQNDAKYAGDLRWYGNQGYDAAYLLKRIQIAADFGKKHGVPVVMGEFGAYPPVAKPEDRARWFAAMRQAVESLKVPNALWGYDDALGFGRKLNGKDLWLDPVVMGAFYAPKSSK